ncbi:DUF2207 domain-containing protein [Patescibacteria group bacterium]|nr:DUF2207 domain-containing protein [Patescibacteria group bacterium]MBU4512307.1 DUF2207 domain-containing protein [Patescibacteria group bacterium]MCG2692758.1 DUF2207 domain-containing protein [Candidatus Parcubacteria bacterium]
MWRKNKIKIIQIIAGALVLSFFLFPAISKASSSEKIEAFNVDIHINQDSSITVIENIFYDFGTNSHYGIYRNIPLQYKRQGGNYNLRLKVISVKDEAGEMYRYKTQRLGRDLQIKIGDPDSLVSGLRLYKIIYRVERALNYFQAHDELYWNVTGNDWDVPVEQAAAQVGLPGYVSPKKLQHACYTGYFAAVDQNCFSQIITGGVVKFGLTQPLGSAQGLTLVFGFPKGVVIEPDTSKKILWFLQDNWFVFLPFIILFILTGLWYELGRDPRGRGTIIPRYGPPDNLTAGEVGTIIDEKFNPRDISAAIIGLAVRGYLKIQEIKIKRLLFEKTDWELIRLKNKDMLAETYERKILTGIFGEQDKRTLGTLKNSFYAHLPKIKKSLYRSLARKRYFPTSPDKVRLTYFIIGLIVIALAFLLVAINQNIYTGISISISGVLIIIFASFMPRKTKKGVLAHEHILGFKKYLEIAEKDRMKFHNAPEKRPETFEKFLPYAMALGVEKQWAQQFKNIYTTPPSWYKGAYAGRFSSIYLINNLADFSKQTNQALAANRGSAGSGRSGFGGGGFSGGGFGGGGGGSW